MGVALDVALDVDSYEEVCEFITGAQPVLLLRHGRPAAVVLDIDSYEAAEVAAGVATLATPAALGRSGPRP